MNQIRIFIFYFNIFCMIYTLMLSLVYILQLFISYYSILKNNKKEISNDYENYLYSANLLPISIIVPTHNEQENIVHNIKDLMQLDLPEFELIVVNDGSVDNTHDLIVKEFELSMVEHAIKISIPTKEVNGVYFNKKYPKLLYVDKMNGGKSDALNAGINASLYPLFVCIDADSRIESDAILRLATEFIKDSTTVVAGGRVRIANGSVINNGKWESFTLPENSIEKFQIVEYFRYFLSGRVSWGKLNSLLIVSGAFGIFNKQLVIELGGYKTNTIGEDMEIVVRIHEHMRKNKKPYKVIFDENAVCWTQGPMSYKDLRSQRRRWQIGLFDTLLAFKKMIMNPRYGVIGLLAIPYSWLFELLGAVIEVFGYFIIILAIFMGQLSIFFFVLFLLLTTALGVILSVGGLILENKVHANKMSAKQCLSLVLYAILENFGYRQYITLCRVEGMIKYRKLRHSWGKISRKRFN